MKIIIATLFMFCVSLNYSFSQGLGIGVGPSFWIGNDVLDWVRNDVPKQNLNMLTNDKNIAFNLNARIKLGTENLRYVFNAGWNRFTIDNINIANPTNSNDLFNLSLTQNIYPLSFGLQYNMPISNVRFYVCGDGVFSIITNTVEMKTDLKKISIVIPFASGSKTDNRIGAALGIGTEVELSALTLDFNLRLHFMNLINKNSDEETTSFLMTNVSIFFGN